MLRGYAKAVARNAQRADHVQKLRIGDVRSVLQFTPFETTTFQAAVRGRSQIIELQWTRANYGGARAWFGCPDCGRRCAVLYARGSGGVCCRRCLRLVYVSQYLDPVERITNRQHKRLRRHGFSVEEGLYEKPRGMHQATWDRILQDDDDDTAAWLQALERQFGFGCFYLPS